jgi:hypothetical protein
MQRLRLIGIVFVILFALAAVAATTASAENPEILPVPTTTTPLNFTVEGQAASLVPTKEEEKSILKCKKVKMSGSFTSADSGTVTVDLEECKGGTANCSTTGDAAGVVLMDKADINLVDYKVGAELLLGIVIEPLEGGKNIFKFKCGILGVEVRGAALGKVSGVKNNVKTRTAKLDYKRTKGEQELTKCELLKAFCAGKEFKLEQNFGAAGFELAGEEVTADITFAKEAEVHF